MRFCSVLCDKDRKSHEGLVGVAGGFAKVPVRQYKVSCASSNTREKFLRSSWRGGWRKQNLDDIELRRYATFGGEVDGAGPGLGVHPPHYVGYLVCRYGEEAGILGISVNMHIHFILYV
jgi:hypothetical protein